MCRPAYLKREVLETAKNLRLSITAGVGSDHNDLDYCKEKGITVLECSGSNVVSVAEHAVSRGIVQMRRYCILQLLYIDIYQSIIY
jgi:formate dehydrogenase